VRILTLCRFPNIRVRRTLAVGGGAISIDDHGATDFRALAENSADIICRVNLQLALVYVSPSAFHVLGWRPDELIGKPPAAIIVAESLPVMQAAHAFNQAHPAENRPVTLQMRKKDGTTAWMEVSARIVFDPVTGKETETVLGIRDVSLRKALEEQLSLLALTDGLTGLANRRAFDENLDREWLRTLREGSQMSLVILDLDHFKHFNDTYGHQVGDDCLRAVADAVRSTIGATDVACRYGGEEIAIILPAADSAAAVRTAEAVRVAIEELDLPHDRNPAGSRVTASFGVATALSRHGGTMRMPEALLLAADNALYKAKHNGRNRIATALLVAVKL
jgi:diguanylate cyclase (GGDEF)-like protein/PAS domain S-box-containing protein